MIALSLALVLAAVVAGALGFSTMNAAKSAIHELQALVLFLTAAVLFCAAAIVEAMRVSVGEVRKGLVLIGLEQQRRPPTRAIALAALLLLPSAALLIATSAEAATVLVTPPGIVACALTALKSVRATVELVGNDYDDNGQVVAIVSSRTLAASRVFAPGESATFWLTQGLMPGDAYCRFTLERGGRNDVRAAGCSWSPGGCALIEAR
jgi:hypothetical protein